MPTSLKKKHQESSCADLNFPEYNVYILIYIKYASERKTKKEINYLIFPTEQLKPNPPYIRYPLSSTFAFIFTDPKYSSASHLILSSMRMEWDKRRSISRKSAYSGCSSAKDPINTSLVNESERGGEGEGRG